MWGRIHGVLWDFSGHAILGERKHETGCEVFWVVMKQQSSFPVVVNPGAVEF